MSKIILITGATDGIGFATARTLREQGHHLLIHGRNAGKLAVTFETLSAISNKPLLETYQADLSNLKEVDQLARSVAERHTHIDVLINNAGILQSPQPITSSGLDVRFVVNTLAPYYLTKRWLPLLRSGSRVINLSSAAQVPVNCEALAGRIRIEAMEAYAQSKLALTMWTRHLATVVKAKGPEIYAVNPGSLLATKMVKEGFGMAGSDVRRGVDILCKAALSAEFEDRTGQYFDNDSGRFTPPHPDALNPVKCAALVEQIDSILGEYDD